MAINVDYQKAITLMSAQVESGRNVLLQNKLVGVDAYSAWEHITKNFLRKIFGENSVEESDVLGYFGARAIPGHADEIWWDAYYRKELSKAIAGLEAQITTLTTFASLEIDQTNQVSRTLGRNVFLVHGHDTALLNQVARFLESTGLKVTVLQEEPNRGQTIIEKFEQHADVGFAVVLLTGDDLGRPAGSSKLQVKARARQNVIFELGYFIGRLGRARVCALYENGVELPSDFYGVLYVSADREGAWKLKLAKELQAAGLEVDLNKAR